MGWNRERVREFNRKYKTNYTRQELEAIEFSMKFRAGNLDVKSMYDLSLTNSLIHIDNEDNVPEGCEVKLAYDKIKARPPKMNQKFIDFVEEHKDEVLHVTRENAKNSLVCLQEDPEKIWLFNIIHDFLYKVGDEWVDYATAFPIPEDAEVTEK